MLSLRLSAIVRLLPISLLIVACSREEQREELPPDTPAPQVQEYFVHGDPMALVEGRKMDGHSFLTRENISQFGNYRFAGMVVLRERSIRKESGTMTQADLEEANKPGGEGMSLADFPSFESALTDGGANVVLDFPRSRPLPLEFRNNPDGTLDLTSVLQVPVKGIHYSRASDGSSFSILFQSQNRENTILGAIYFFNSKVERWQGNVNASHHYLLGPGYATRWVRPMDVRLCGDFTEPELTESKKAIFEWAKAGFVGQHSLRVEENVPCAPFSDVNENSVQFLSGFRFEDDDKFTTLGVTFSIVNPLNRQIVASDVIISRMGLALAGRQSGERTVKHEFGHFLGLHHEFDRTAAGNYVNASIMGYEDEERITDFDRESIELVYGQYPSFGAFGDEVDAQVPFPEELPFLKLCQAAAEPESTVEALKGLMGSDDCLEVASKLAGSPSLVLKGANFDNLAALSGLTYLHDLSLIGTKVASVAPLADLPKLQSLVLQENMELKDLSPLAALTSLTELVADGNNAIEFSNAETCPRGPTVPQALRAFCSSGQTVVAGR